MTETVLVLPLVLIVLALLFFFGSAMTRWQRSSVTDRYEAWRQAQYAPGPGLGFGKGPVEFEDSELLNEAFFAGNAERVEVGGRAGRVRVSLITDLVAEEAALRAPVSVFPHYDPESADQMVRDRARSLPAWWRIDLETEHTSTVPFYQRFAGTVKHQSTVIDGDWSYGSWIEQRYRGDRKSLGTMLTRYVHFIGDDDRYDGDIYPDLDDLHPHGVLGVYQTFYTEGLDWQLRTLDEDLDNRYAHKARVTYLGFPAYRGPQILPELSPINLWYNPDYVPEPGDDL